MGRKYSSFRPPIFLNLKKNSQFSSASSRINSQLNKGFTFIELLMVIGIISLLVGALITLYDPRTQIGKADDAKKRETITQIKNALDAYYQDKNVYPPCIPFPSLTVPCSISLPQFSPYMNKLPIYSTANGPYYNAAPSSSQWFVITWKKDFTKSASVGLDCPLFSTSGCNIPQLDDAVYICGFNGIVDCAGVTIP